MRPVKLHRFEIKLLFFALHGQRFVANERDLDLLFFYLLRGYKTTVLYL
jgi:hypothetical protein